jgi:hypothetical protein
MKLLADEESGQICKTGIGVADVSPLQADIELERLLFSRGTL